MAVPGWPLPTFWTASAARMRTVSTARTSRSLQPAFLATGDFSVELRLAVAEDWVDRAGLGTEVTPHAGCRSGLH